MSTASDLLPAIALDAVNDAFRSCEPGFRASRDTSAWSGRTSRAILEGSQGAGCIQLSVEESILSASAVPLEKRNDLVNELTNMLAGDFEYEFLRRGLSIRYRTPHIVQIADVNAFERGRDGMLRTFEGRTGRVAVGVELTLPDGVELEAPATPRGPTRPKIAFHSPSQKMAPGSVLVVDDSANVRAEVVATLASAGFDVLQAGSAFEALQLMRKRPSVRLVFTDLHMQGMAGSDLIRTIKSDEKLAGTQIAVLTASPVAMTEVDRSLVVACLLKPISQAAVIMIAHRAVLRIN